MVTYRVPESPPRVHSQFCHRGASNHQVEQVHVLSLEGQETKTGLQILCQHVHPEM